jgi:hypothetical protein
MDMNLSALAGIALVSTSLGFLFVRVIVEVRRELRRAPTDARGVATWQS